MEAYAVFEGGGVKGAALAGALSAAQESGLEFVGYGGASAGSIVAFLATIGYSPEELLGVLLRYRLTDFLEDKTGAKLEDPKTWINNFNNNRYKKFGMFLSPAFYYLFSRRLRYIYKILKGVASKNGMYKTINLEDILWELVVKKFPNNNFSNKCITFKQLYELTKIELKIIASDVHNGQAIIFDHLNSETADCCVINTICASSSYPLVFEPNVSLLKNRLLVDGGLSCNLPSFIFNDKINYRKLPLYAFDLYKNNENDPASFKKKNILEFGWGLITTSLDASNSILSSLIDAIPVKVRVPNDVETLDFKIKKASILEMYETGKHSARESFKCDELTKKAVASNGDPTKLVRALYGYDFYLNILDSIIHLSEMPNVNVRTWLYASITNDDSKLVAICWQGSVGAKNFRDEYVFDKMGVSDTYQCWCQKVPIISETSKSSKNLSIDYTRVCLPIFDMHHIVDGSNTIVRKIVGVLVLEMDKSKDVCFWLNEEGTEVSDEFSRVIRNWLSILSKLMVSKDVRI